MALELKTGEKTAKSVKIPTKTKVNLCKKEPKSRNVATLVIGIAAILALSLYTVTGTADGAILSMRPDELLQLLEGSEG